MGEDRSLAASTSEWGAELRRPPREHDRWLLDWLVQTTGRVYHFQKANGRTLPATVRTHAMISKHLGLAAGKAEMLAKDAMEAGAAETAKHHFFTASNTYAAAQHVIFETNEEKRFLHEGAMRCYAAYASLTSPEIRHVLIPFEGTTLGAYLHLADLASPAPCIVVLPGCDMTKEMYPGPGANHAAQRGMHMLVLDGPGQGEANLRDLKLTSTNYARAVSAAIDVVSRLPEVDGRRIGVYGMSFSSQWAMAAAAHDDRIRAVAAPLFSGCDKYYLMNVEGPRWRWLFMYLTGAASEDELNEIMRGMRLDDLLPGVRCPCLWAVGEYDARSPVREVLRLFDLMTNDRELWIFADQHHQVNVADGRSVPVWGSDINMYSFDWLEAHLDGAPDSSARRRIRYLQPGEGPYSRAARTPWPWYRRFSREGAQGEEFEEEEFEEAAPAASSLGGLPNEGSIGALP